LSVTSSPGLLLLGFFAEKEAVPVIRNLCVCGNTQPHALRAKWVEARKNRGGPVASAGQPSVEPLPAELMDYGRQVAALSRLQEGIDGMTCEIVMVEAERVYAYQAGVFLDRVNAAKGAISGPDDLQAIARVCLPLDAKIDPETVNFEQGPPFRMRTTNANARVQRYGFGEPHPDSGLIPVVFLVGEAEPCIQVIEFKGRFYLRNGYHRAVGLMRRGVQQLPALVMHAAKWEDVNHELGKGWFFDPRRLGADMPTLRHFANASEVPLRVFETVTEYGWRAFPRPI
jgi:hypothetical protein